MKLKPQKSWYYAAESHRLSNDKINEAQFQIEAGLHFLDTDPVYISYLDKIYSWNPHFYPLVIINIKLIIFSHYTPFNIKRYY